MPQTVEFLDPALRSVLKLRGFKVNWNKVPKGGPTSFGRRHFYMILLSIGNSRIYYGDKVIHLNGVYLFFANSRIPYSTEIIAENHAGYRCIFSEEFIKPVERLESLRQSPLFKTGENPAFKLDAAGQARLQGIFDTMIEADAANYLYRDDLMRNYIQLIVHEALQMQPAENVSQHNNASLRLTTNFLEMLERQFPVADRNLPLKLNTAKDYAEKLCVHVNYLNRAVKEITGKTTTHIIAGRTASEATGLLRYTDWSVAEIAYALGFEYPNYFSKSFKKTTGHTPGFYRSL